MEILNYQRIKEDIVDFSELLYISFHTLMLSQLMYLVFWYEMMLLSEHMIGGARSVRSLTVMVYRNHLL